MEELQILSKMAILHTNPPHNSLVLEVLGNMYQYVLFLLLVDNQSGRFVPRNSLDIM